MYLQNKYTKCYYNIINRAKSRDLLKEIYTELHHIIPRSLGGNNSKENLVKLTAREHFICHLLLPRMLVGVSKQKMSFAIWSMLNRDHSLDKSRYKINSYRYSQLKSQISVAISESNTGRKRSDQFRQQMRDRKLGKKNEKIAGENHYTKKEGYVSKISGTNHYMHGKTQSESANQKRREKILGTKRSDETRKKQSEARRLYWESKKQS